MDAPKKPIAVLSDSLPNGIQFILTSLGDKVAEYNSQRARVFDTDGQEYIIITDVNRLKGLEISDYRVAPGFGVRNYTEAERMVKEARTRMR